MGGDSYGAHRTPLLPPTLGVGPPGSYPPVKVSKRGSKNRSPREILYGCHASDSDRGPSKNTLWGVRPPSTPTLGGYALPYGPIGAPSYGPHRRGDQKHLFVQITFKNRTGPQSDLRYTGCSPPGAGSGQRRNLRVPERGGGLPIEIDLPSLFKVERN